MKNLIKHFISDELGSAVVDWGVFLVGLLMISVAIVSTVLA